jgi:hypothetical protein
MNATKVVIYTIFATTFFGCNQENSNDNKAIEGVDSIQFQIAQKYDSINDANRNNLLETINEIEIKEKDKEAYRFEWSRSFHGPMLYTIEEFENRYILKIVSVNQNKTDSINNSKLVLHDPIYVSENDWMEFKELLDSADYWRLNSGEKEGKGMLDGSIWTLEGKIPANDLRGEKYHKVTRFSPDTGFFRKACLKLIKLGPVIDKDKTY